MVDRVNIGTNLLGEIVDSSELKVKSSSRKRRRPGVSPQLQDRILNFLPEEVAESPVRKFLKQFEYSEDEEMPKGNKSETETTNMDKNKQELDDLRKEIKETIETSSSEIKIANANSVDQIKKDQQEFMAKISEVISNGQAGVDKKISALSDKVD